MSKNWFLKSHIFHNESIKYYTEMLNSVYLYYILSTYTDLISKIITFESQMPHSKIVKCRLVYLIIGGGGFLGVFFGFFF